MSKICHVYRLGTLPYQSAWDLQRRLAAQIAERNRPPTLLLLEHPHVFTFGRSGSTQNLLWDTEELEHHGIQVIWADRGGDVTYHGPGQLVGYPLLPLSPGGIFAGSQPNSPIFPQLNIPKADYIGYIRRLEQVLIQTLAHFNVQAVRLEGKTGVWLSSGSSTARDNPAKIASIGVKVDARGVSLHGFSLNINPDMRYWDGIVACGLAGHPAASLAEILHPVPSMSDVEETVIDAFRDPFGFEMVEADIDSLPGEGEET